LDLGRSEIKSLEKAWSFKDGGSKEEKPGSGCSKKKDEGVEVEGKGNRSESVKRKFVVRVKVLRLSRNGDEQTIGLGSFVFLQLERGAGGADSLSGWVYQTSYSIIIQGRCQDKVKLLEVPLMEVSSPPHAGSRRGSAALTQGASWCFRGRSTTSVHPWEPIS
jgi:hypothetical protein